MENTTSILDSAQQPYSYLIESIRARDGQILQQSTHMQTMEEDIRLDDDNNRRREW